MRRSPAGVARRIPDDSSTFSLTTGTGALDEDCGGKDYGVAPK
jgi:hypothetical protein